MNLGAIILAAGASTRMGKPKQLLPYQGKTLLAHAISRVERAGVQNFVVVTGAHRFEKEFVGKNVRFVHNTHWEAGMGTSVGVGLKALQAEATSELDGVLVMLSDQPLIRSAHLTQLINAFSFNKTTIVAIKYLHGLGVPAIFDRSAFEQLLHLRGDKGARELLNNKLTQAIAIATPTQHLLDIDTKEDYSKLLEV